MNQISISPLVATSFMNLSVSSTSKSPSCSPLMWRNVDAAAQAVRLFASTNAWLRAVAAQMARVLGHLTIVGVGNAALPVNFASPPHECSVASPFWGSIPELIEVITLAKAGKIQMLVEHFPLERADEAYQLLHDGKIQGRAVIKPHN
jgi:D-arabinose 1-dehydrogenase-like Zn-dependent alcohol dehydrogenase